MAGGDEQSAGTAAALQGAPDTAVGAYKDLSTSPLVEEPDEAPTYTVRASRRRYLVMEVCVNVGDSISRGYAVAIMERMKMERSVLAEEDGVTVKINIRASRFIEVGDDLMGVD